MEDLISAIIDIGISISSTCKLVYIEAIKGEFRLPFVANNTTKP